MCVCVCQKHWPDWDDLSRCEVEACFWHDRLRIEGHQESECTKTKLPALQQEIRGQQPSGTGKSNRGMKAQQELFECRRGKALKHIDEALKLLQDKPRDTEALHVQQVVHMRRGCSGEHCDVDDPIYGDRFHCQRCKQNFCTQCYAAHPPSHPLMMHRVALPDDIPTDGDKWRVNGIVGHRDSASGREYLVRWHGNWKDEWHFKSDLNNDDLVDEYEESIIKRRRKRCRLTASS